MEYVIQWYEKGQGINFLALKTKDVEENGYETDEPMAWTIPVTDTNSACDPKCICSRIPNPKHLPMPCIRWGFLAERGINSDGTPIYELDRVPTRNEAITMLVALIGKTEQAKAGNWDIPFTDVEPWARPYVGYAYAHQLTSGAFSHNLWRKSAYHRFSISDLCSEGTGV